MGTRSRWFWGTLIVAAVAIGVVGYNLKQKQNAEQAWASFLGGDPSAGGRVFFSKSCSTCHAISGTGGDLASDLGMVVDRRLSLGELVGVMWNHAPDMWDAMSEHRIEIPRINLNEMEDLFAYLYFVRYLDEPGDAATGKRLLQEKQCVACHVLGTDPSAKNSDLRKWGAFDNPLLWTERMWNHGDTMMKALREKGMAWPTFEGREMVDLLAYIRKASSVPSIAIDYLPANPETGRHLFEEKSCSHCHPIRGQGGRSAPDLGRVTGFPRTLTQVAGLMWNHSPEMWEAMAEEGISRPTFTREEMADLLSYLYAVSYFDEPGDAARGKQVYAEKQCSSCHGGEGKAATGGPEMSKWRGRTSPLYMAYVMWRHGPKMYQKLRDRGAPWPIFKDQEMNDLLAFLHAES